MHLLLEWLRWDHTTNRRLILFYFKIQMLYIPLFLVASHARFSPWVLFCSCEEFFSVSGRICSDLRTSLIPEHVEEQSCNYYWKREELDYEDKRGEARLKASTKFATLSIKMQLIPPTETSEENNEAMEESTIEIVENIAAVTGMKAAVDAIAAIAAANDDNERNIKILI